MSFKAKNLAYEAKEPAFLQKLRSQYGDTSGRLERPIARPRKPKDNRDDDDAPTYVDEESNEVISKEEYEAMVRSSTQEGGEQGRDQADRPASEADKEGKATAEQETFTSKQNMAEIGGPRKRKQVKVVGEENAAVTDKEKPEDPVSRKPKQKKKKIKLSFDDE